jgi:poly-gamma-glutamate capsule biosynthesis protein CapA/YwtB (metallophosphatase superfamily)
LDAPDPDHWLSGIAACTRSAGCAIGHLEVPHTLGGTELGGDVPAPGALPAHLAALERAGFDVVTLAGNHMADRGAEGIADTCAELDQLGIRHCGAGADLDQARAPARFNLGSARFAVLSYNCVGPEASWASAGRAGCAYIKVDTADGSPIAPAAPLQTADADSLAAMSRDIAAAALDGALVVVALHKGIVHMPARLAPYERPIAHRAIDAGAAIVVSHHAHILRGIEFYRGKPIFHGLGNGCVVTQALSPDQSHPARAQWARQRRQRFGFEPDPAYTLAPFHPEAIHALLARVRLLDGGEIEAGFIPVYVEPPGRPVLAQGAAADRVIEYVRRITVEAGLPALKFVKGDAMVVVT